MTKIEDLLRFYHSIDDDYYISTGDGLDQYRNIIKELRQDLRNEINNFPTKANPITKYKIIKSIMNANVKPINHYIEKIDRYKKEGWVDKT